MQTTDKVIRGVTYERDYLNKGCTDCVANGYYEGLCGELHDEDCCHVYSFKIKDITKKQSSSKQQGVKYDNGKTLYSLVPPYALEAVAQNLTDNLKKYKERNNWMKVENAQERYLDALYRHLEAHRRGEVYDTDSVNPETTHMSAVAVNALFLLEFMLNPELKGKE